MKFSVVLFSSLVSASAIVPRSPPSNVTLDVFYSGNGCAPGSTTATIASDRSSIRIDYTKYIVDTSETQVRKNCQVQLGLKYPRGYMYSVSKSEYRGNAVLQSGAKAELVSNMFVGGSSLTVSTSGAVSGSKYVSGATYALTVAASEAIYSPCGGTSSSILNVPDQVRTTKHTGATPNRIDAQLHRVYLNWALCT